MSDCYAVQTDPENPLRYRFDGEWREMQTQDVAIQVANAETHLQTSAYTDHNGVRSPVIARSGATAFVVSSPYMNAAHLLDEEIDRLNRARNVHEAKHAMRDPGMFGQNLMFADAEGNSRYVRAGRAPIRPKGFDWSRPVPGNGSETASLGLHPLEDLVQITNPSVGYMQNHNLAPDRITLSGAPAETPCSRLPWPGSPTSPPTPLAEAQELPSADDLIAAHVAASGGAELEQMREQASLAAGLRDPSMIPGLRGRLECLFSAEEVRWEGRRQATRSRKRVSYTKSCPSSGH